MNTEQELESLCGVKSLWERKDDPTCSTDWDRVVAFCPDLAQAWFQVKMAKLAFGALLQEKIDER